ncbi:helix-hairpin-helix domain-containing protein [Kribbella kalugense]|uniref:Pathogenicity locus Cdd1 protein n=1 Tax=Kribbella kalugense TaxID=2512221 RepID=A0A4R7ZUC1_9ACTN|nr:helix-hairpin-helix domain-containing protein [Kribbella kalugense]TDW21186.1 pathogenicity locus Cdd1 protein [Kribbella kalugense]
MSKNDPTDLTSLMNVGAAVAGYLGRADITHVDQLVGRDPFEIYETICERDAVLHDPCLLDTIMSATDQANGNPARPWWSYTPVRKQLLEQRG